MSLPIAALQQSVCSALKSEHVIVHAPTGSGKSTALPLWAAEQGCVLVVQPRRIATTALAEYLAQQRGESVGESIGYAIRFDAHIGDNTQVVFATPGVALRWFFENDLAQFNVVMLDEFHERRWDTDLLLALLKANNAHRLLITSATLNSQSLAHYLSAKSFTSEGRSYPIHSEFFSAHAREMPSNEGLAQRVIKACDYALDQGASGVLVFLPGRAEIQACLNASSQLSAHCIGLHGASKMQAQQQAISSSDEPRVIFATNVAQTSLTISDIDCVVDSGLERRTHLRKGKTVLALEAIAKDSLAQRRGRCGRTKAGLYIGLFGEHAPLLETTAPEVEREALDDLVLGASCAGHSIDALALPSPLPAASLSRAITNLQRLGAIDDTLIATDVGKALYPLPVDAELGYLIINMPNGALRQAMIDLASVIMTPQALCSRLSENQHEAIERTKLKDVLNNDLLFHIALLRGQLAEFVHPDETALSEATTYSQHLRHTFDLPALDKSARFNSEELLNHIAKLCPHAVYVRRDNRRGAFANGEDEVRIARDSLVCEQSPALLVLDTFSLAGKGKKHSDTLASFCANLTLKQVQAAVQTQPQVRDYQWLQNDEYPDGVIRCEVNHTYAGVVIATQWHDAQNEHLHQAIVQLMRNNTLFTGCYAETEKEIAYHALYNNYHALAPLERDCDNYLRYRLKQLGVHHCEDLSLIEADDFSYHFLDKWQLDDFKNSYPLIVELPSMQLEIEYQFRAKRIVAHWLGGDRKDPPKRWELPAWQGFKVRFKKASKVVDVR